MAGKFTSVNKMRMDPSQEWQSSEGEYEGEMCEGTSSDGGKTITFGGEMMCPMEGTMKPYKYQYEIKSTDEFVMRWWSPSMTDGKMFESMVITSTRVK